MPKVLIVADKETIVEPIQLYLTNDACQVLDAGNGLKSCWHLRREGKHPACIPLASRERLKGSSLQTEAIWDMSLRPFLP